MRLLPAALVGLLLLAGCTSQGPRTAREALDVALKEAHGWDTSARLLSVSGAEMANAKGYVEALKTLGTDEKELADEGVTALLPGDDGNLGDGRLPAWGFTFGHDTPGTLRVVVGGGKATFTKESPGASNGLPDLATDARWVVDSGRVNDVFRGNRTLGAIHDSPSGVLTYVLNAAPKGAVLRWEVAGGERGILNQTFHARVSALNGTLVVRQQRIVIDRAPELPGIEAGELKGSAMVGSPTHATFQTGEHTLASFLLRIPGGTVPGNLRATIVSPEGQTKTLHASAFLPGSGGEDHGTVERFVPGQWAVTFSVPTGVSEDYALYWCTDGSGPAPDNPAC
ncbi:MAG: hypothetical protein QOI63_1085 [Thermoplasmata archaeon]|jgi:hypothetical protein|nr:hypothetical protein [Thermoplasmata archaeon]